MNKHVTVPIFIPHLGCPHDCSFCNQKAISGTLGAPSPEQVISIIEKARESLGERTGSAELAFFGGSFTAVPADYRTVLLNTVKPFIGADGFRGIRISTRPDYITHEILEQLAASHVTTIELGVQSMSERVLLANRRGHTVQAVKQSVSLIRQYQFRLGLQMMTGLYQDDSTTCLQTAKELIALQPDMVRIYPTIVLRGTYLAELWQTGAYKPQTLEQAVELGAALLQQFEAAKIPVIRFGLHDEAEMKQQMLAGPHHPALRELCESRLLLHRVWNQIEQAGIPAGCIQLQVHPKAVSKIIGQKRSNLLELQNRGYHAAILKNDKLSPLQVLIQ